MKPRKERPYDKSLRPVRQPGQLGDWAAIVVLALSVGLWMLWPSAPDGIREFPVLPEPACAYGLISPSSFAGNVLARFGDGPAGEDSGNMFARLPAADTPPIPPPASEPPAELPPPSYAANDLPRTLELPPPPAFPFRRLPPTHTGLVVQVSEQLRDAGFAFEPPATGGDSPFSLSASLSFDHEGCVEFLVVDDFSGKDTALPLWRYALGISRTATNATGTVAISWQ